MPHAHKKRQANGNGQSRPVRQTLEMLRFENIELRNQVADLALDIERLRETPKYHHGEIGQSFN